MSSSSFSCTNFGRACILQFLKKKCKCNNFADVRISTSDRNPLKLYFVCKNDICGFVDWLHPINCPCHDKHSAQNVDEGDEVSSISNVVKALEGRILTVERDLKQTTGVVNEIKNIATSSKFMCTSMLLIVFLTFLVVLIK
jgi:hypothetical protein